MTGGERAAHTAELVIRMVSDMVPTLVERTVSQMCDNCRRWEGGTAPRPNASAELVPRQERRAAVATLPPGTN